MPGVVHNTVFLVPIGLNTKPPARQNGLSRLKPSLPRLRDNVESILRLLLNNGLAGSYSGPLAGSFIPLTSPHLEKDPLGTAVAKEMEAQSPLPRCRHAFF